MKNVIRKFSKGKNVKKEEKQNKNWENEKQKKWEKRKNFCFVKRTKMNNILLYFMLYITYILWKCLFVLFMSGVCISMNKCWRKLKNGKDNEREYKRNLIILDNILNYSILFFIGI